MALATQCPFCQTTFRVANDQLKLRDGLVRCGHCHEVFDGNAHLLGDRQSHGNWPTPPSNSSSSAPPALTSQIITPAIARANAAAPHYGEPPVAALPDPEALAEIEAAWDLPPPADDEFPAPVDEQAEAGMDANDDDDNASVDTLTIEEDASDGLLGEAFPEPNVNDDIDFSARALPLQPSSAPHDDVQLASPADDNAFAEAANPAASAEAFDDIGETPDQPEFILAAQRRQRHARVRRILTVVFSVILILTGLAQGIYLERNRIALAAPQLKPLLVAACQPLRCTVGLQRQIDQLSIESNELQAATPDQPTLTLNLLLRNRADSALAWPDIELTLNDDDETALIRRVFTPAEYLPAGQTLEAGIAGDTEQPIRLSFTLTQGTASGYRVYLFYP